MNEKTYFSVLKDRFAFKPAGESVSLEEIAREYFEGGMYNSDPAVLGKFESREAAKALLDKKCGECESYWYHAYPGKWLAVCDIMYIEENIYSVDEDGDEDWLETVGAYDEHAEPLEPHWFSFDDEEED